MFRGVCVFRSRPIVPSIYILTFILSENIFTFVSKRYRPSINDCRWLNSEIFLFFFITILWINIYLFVDLFIYSDICSSANSTPLHENYYRSQNCIYNATVNLCDRNLDQKWYRSAVDILTSCPESLQCGAPYPLWLNGKCFIVVRRKVMSRVL
jgi:hypothetical protein